MRGRLLQRLPKTSIMTPLDWRKWSQALSLYPDETFKEYIISGLKQGFRIGLKGSRCCSAVGNMKSAMEQPQVVSEYLQRECAAGRILGPFTVDELSMSDMVVSRFGVIPKSSPENWRLIVDLSFPEWVSENDGIDPGVCSLQYSRVEDATEEVLKEGPGSFMVKIDIKSAYRTVPVHPQDWWLLGMQWEGAYYVDTTLPFGLRSAPKIFTAITDAAEWILKERGVQFCLHYLDDYLIIGPNQEQCARDLRIVLSTFAELGLPVAKSKLEGPATCLTFLGFEIDSVLLEMRLPKDKLHDLQVTTSAWAGRRSCWKKELESLVGKLAHASRAVRPGKTFLRSLIELVKGIRKDFHHIRMNAAARSDIYWWSVFAQTWIGVSLIRELGKEDVDYEVMTDASGRFGCGGPWGNRWFQVQWSPGYRITKLKNPFSQDSILLRELLPVVIAAAIWEKEWKNSVVRVRCDNDGAVAAINSGYSKIQGISHLLRCLFFFQAHYGLHVKAEHIPGRENVLADAISRE